MLNILIALMVEKLILTQKEGEALAKKLGESILPSDFKESQQFLKKIIAKLD